MLASASLLGGPAWAEGPLDRLQAVWQLEQWDRHDGLPQSTVTAIHPTGDGRLWLATFAGLAIFDGQQIEPVVAAPGERRPLRATALADRGDGGLWIGTEREGLWYLQEGHFVQEMIAREGEEPTTTRVLETSDGVVWLATNQGAYRRSAAGSWEQLTERAAFDVDLAPDGAIWLCGHLVQRVAEGQVQTLELDHDQHCLGGAITPEGDFLALFDDRLQLLGAQGELRATVPLPGLEPGFMSEPGLDPFGRVWVGSGEGVVDLGPLDLLLQGQVEARTESLSGGPRAIHITPTGTVWLGLTGSGLVRLAPGGFRRLPVPKGSGGAGPLAASEDTLWMSLECMDVVGVRLEGGHQELDLPTIEGGPCITAMAATEDGLLVARDYDLIEVDAEGTRTRWRGPGHISLIQLGEGGVPLVGTTNGELVRLEGTEIVRIEMPEAVSGRRLLVARERGGDLVVGHEDGLAWRRDGSWSLFGSEQGLPQGAVRDLAWDSEGVLWVATYGGGLGWVSDEDVGGLPIGPGGLGDAFLSSIWITDDGGVLLQGNGGLTRLRLDELRRARTSAAHQLASVVVPVGEANGWLRPSSVVGPDGSLWLAGVDAVTVVDTSSLGQQLQVPAVLLQSAHVGDQQLRLDGETSVSPVAWRRLEVRYSAPTLEPGLTVSYEHRLQRRGAPEVGWVSGGRSHRATYPGLEPGRYTFEVRAVGVDGRVGGTASLAVHLVPAWHERGLVRGGLALALLALVVFLGVLRTRAAERRSQLLQDEIDRRREVERDLAVREARYRQVFTQAANAFLLYAPEGHCLDVNEEACRLFGSTREELLQAQPEDLGLPREEVSGLPGGTPIVCTRADGGRFPARVDAVPCALKEGQGRLCSVVDLSALVDAHEDEDRLRRKLHQAQRLESLGRLAGGVAHDMNNVLAVVSTNLDLVGGALPPGDQGLEFVRDARQGVERGVAMVRQLLALSRSQQPDSESADVLDVVSGLQDMLRRLMPEDVGLDVRGESGAVAHISRRELEQVVLSLVLNAADNAPSKTSVQVRVHTVPTQSVLHLDVIDQGPGRALVLPSVQGMIEGFGGKVDVEARAGQSTRVRLSLPLAPLTAAASSEPSEGAAAVQGRGQLLAVVDDNEILLRAISRQLRWMGFEVVTWSDPSVALSAMRAMEQPPALLLTDVVMPRLNGRQLATEVRETWPDLPVLFMSGYTADVLGELAPGDSGEALLQKPSRPSSWVGPWLGCSRISRPGRPRRRRAGPRRAGRGPPRCRSGCPRRPGSSSAPCGRPPRPARRAR